jgi:CHAD domain-containing protein
MKARRVKGLDPADSFRVNAERMARVRIDELWSFGARALDPDEVEALHDMRIAAKRLRYLLEISEPCFGRPAKEGAKLTRSIQDLLGEIHDCDVMAPRVRAHADRLRGADVQAVFDATPPDADDLDPALLETAVNGPRYRGLEALATFLEARRRVLHREFVTRWADLQEDDFRRRLERALEQAP